MDREDYSKPQFAGSCMGVDLKDRGPHDKHQCIVICVEDDENWFRKVSVSSYWLDEMIAKLQEAKAHLDATCIKGEYGYDRE